MYENRNWKTWMPKQNRRGRKPTRYYLAYGSNLNMYQMMNRCPGAHRRGWGGIEGYELLYKGSKTGAYLTIEEKAGGHVPVGVFTVTEEDERKLDRYEGFLRFYYKKDLRIRIWDQVLEKYRWIDAFVYIMHEDRPYGIPSPLYVATCMEGYEDFEFDKDILEDAYERSVIGVARQEEEARA